MQRQLLLSIGSLLISFSSLIAAPIDSVGVENLNGKKLIVHKVEPKENYYSISRKYLVSPQTTINYNNNKGLQIGVLIKVPTERAFANRVITVPVTSTTISGAKMEIVKYKVGAKETFYSIAKKFNTSVDALKQLNNISSNSLTAGRIIKIRYGTLTAEVTPPTPIILPKIFTEGTAGSSQIDSSLNAGDRLKLPPSRYGLREIDDHGVAIWIADESLDGTKMLALHRTAPIGTVVKVTNPMTSKSTFAKVVGKFTENESTRDVMIVVTKATADLIGALDRRFQVNIVYGVQNE
ncbi:MAG: LysM peptidoglycan-binding domain-containing protein [Flavobacterium sp.]|nr:LysM peptidoglycan-binding domain-containing protein [Pedobacter sp.]